MSFFPFKNNTHDLWTCFQYLKEVHVHIDTGWAGHNIPVYVSIACQVLTRASHDWCRHHSWTLPDAEVRDTQNWGQLGGATWKEVEDQHSLLTDEMLHLSLWVSYGISTPQQDTSSARGGFSSPAFLFSTVTAFCPIIIAHEACTICNKWLHMKQYARKKPGNEASLGMRPVNHSNTTQTHMQT